MKKNKFLLAPRWRKVLRDLWDNKPRTILVVLAIAVGVMAFGSVYITYDIMIADMNKQYQDINPASIILSFDEFDEELVEWIKDRPEVEAAQGTITHPVTVLGLPEKQTMLLKAFTDYSDMQVNMINSEQGNLPPPKGAIYLERTTTKRLNKKYGSEIKIQLADEREHTLSFQGQIHDLNAIPAHFYPIYTAYVTTDTLRGMNLSTQLNTLNIRLMPQYTTLEEVESIADQLIEDLEDRGYKVGIDDLIKPNEHWAADPAKGVITILQGMGIFSLILSGFLVVNTISAILAQQKKQIGIMKTVGATGKQIVGVYVFMMLVLGILALLIGVPASMLVAYIMIQSVVGFLNVNLINFYLPTYILLMQVGAAIIIPIVAGIVPILNGVKISAYQAIFDYGVISLGKSFIDRFMTQIKGLSRPLMVSLRSSFRKKGRVIMTLSTLMLAGGLYMGVINVRGALDNAVDQALQMFNYDVQVNFDGVYDANALERRAKQVDEVASAEARAFVNAQKVKVNDELGEEFTIVGMPAESDFADPNIIYGRWLLPGNKKELVMTSELYRIEKLKVGQTLTLKINDEELDFKLVGVTSSTIEELAYMDFDYVSQLRGTKGLASRLLIKTRNHNQAAQIAAAKDIEDRFEKAGIKVTRSMTQHTIMESNSGQFDFVIGFLLAMSAMVALVGALGLAGTMSLNVLERTREIGVMRSIGAVNLAIGSMVIIEGLLIGIISWFMGFVVSFPFGILFSHFLGIAMFERPIDFVFMPSGTVYWLIMVVVISIVASLLPARKAIKVSVREALAYE